MRVGVKYLNSHIHISSSETTEAGIYIENAENRRAVTKEE